MSRCSRCGVDRGKIEIAVLETAAICGKNEKTIAAQATLIKTLGKTLKWTAENLENFKGGPGPIENALAQYRAWLKKNGGTG